MAIGYYKLYECTVFMIICNTIFYLLYWVSFVKYLENDETLLRLPVVHPAEEKRRLDPNRK